MIPMWHRLRALAEQLQVIFRYRVLASFTDPKAMYQFVNLIVRFHYKRRPSELPDLPLAEILPRTAAVSGVTLLFPAPEFLSIETDELWYLCTIARALQPSCVFEFGTFDGFTTVHLAANTPESCWVITMDKQAGEYRFRWLRRFTHSIEVGGRFRRHPLGARITLITADSTAFDFSVYRSSVGLVFIDADHGYEPTKKDTENALMMLKPGGVIVWHDCFSPGVSRFLREFSAAHRVARIAGTTLVCYLKDEAGVRLDV